MSIRDDLISLYLQKWTDTAAELRDIQPSGKLSLPLLIDPVVGGYMRARPRWLVVGQETKGWGEWDHRLTANHGVSKALALYREFRLGEKYYRSPFWVANRELSGSANRANSEPNFLWTNLIKIDEEAHRPSDDVEELICKRFDVLADEIQILAPDAIVFFVGPNYEARLNRTLPNVRYELIESFKSKLLYRCEHALLPFRSFWTYHPNYLRRSRNWNVVDVLGRLILEPGRER